MIRKVPQQPDADFLKIALEIWMRVWYTEHKVCGIVANEFGDSLVPWQSAHIASTHGTLRQLCRNVVITLRYLHREDWKWKPYQMTLPLIDFLSPIIKCPMLIHKNFPLSRLLKRMFVTMKFYPTMTHEKLPQHNRFQNPYEIHLDRFTTHWPELLKILQDRIKPCNQILIPPLEETTTLTNTKLPDTTQNILASHKPIERIA